jgi:quercetin dioxygenase-like cupin family protein
MDSTNLSQLTEDLFARAGTGHSGRAGATLHGDRHHALRQTVIAMTAGAELSEHESPGEATLQVLRGEVRLTCGSAEWTGCTGELVAIPPERHALLAVEDSAVLLTVVVTPA